MAKVEKNIAPDSTGMGGTEVTTVAHEVYPLKPNEKKTKEYKSNEELQRDRFRAFEAAKEDAWVPDRDSVPEEVVTTYKKVISDNSESYVNRFRTPKKSVKLFVALRLVRKNAKYKGVMRLSDLQIIAGKTLEKYDELVQAASGAPIDPITKHPDIKTFIEAELDAYNNGGKKEPTIGSSGPTVVGPTGVSPAASNIPGPRPAPAGSPVRPIGSGINLGGSALGTPEHGARHARSVEESAAGPSPVVESATSPAAAAAVTPEVTPASSATTASPSPAAAPEPETVTEEEVNSATAPDPAAAAAVTPEVTPASSATTASPSPAAAPEPETVTEEEVNSATAPDPADLAELPPITTPRVEPPTGKYAAYNTEVRLTENPAKPYFVKADDYNTYEFGMEVTGYDPKKKKLTKLKKLQLHEVYTQRVDDSNRGTGYFIKPSDLGRYNGSAHVYGWDGTRSEPELIYITDHL